MWSAGMQGAMGRRGLRRSWTMVGAFLLAGGGSWWLAAIAQNPNSQPLDSQPLDSQTANSQTPNLQPPISQAPNSPEAGAVAEGQPMEGMAPFSFLEAGRLEVARESGPASGEDASRSSQRNSLPPRAGGGSRGEETLSFGNAGVGNAGTAGGSAGAEGTGGILGGGAAWGPLAGAAGVSGGGAAVSRAASAGEVIGFTHVDEAGTQRITLVHTGKSWIAVYHIDRSGTLRLMSSRPIDADFSLQLNATSPLPEEIRQMTGSSR